MNTPAVAIEVVDVSRRYGPLLAVDGVGFTVAAGEVVGFLGPNGAGKTTTLRMLAGSLAPTRGAVRICGHDVGEAPRRAKARLGYLPERPPVYDDMVVADYVAFCARLREVSAPHAAAAEVMGRVGVAHVAHRLVGHLSKGYRQRVGLAGALVHAPAALLLDEPTSGLDPVQRVEVRQLVRELAAGGVAVLLSTHVLAEVAETCDRALILHRGRLVGEHRPRAPGTELRVRVARPEGLEAALAALPGVGAVTLLPDGALRVTGQGELRAAVARVAVDHDLLELRASDGLEAHFLRLVEEA